MSTADDLRDVKVPLNNGTSAMPALESTAEDTAPPAPETQTDVVAAVASTDENLPAQPSRGQIKEALSAVRPALEACSASAHGTMFANINTGVKAFESRNCQDWTRVP